MPELNTNLLANIGQNVPSYSKALGQSTQLKDMINQEQLGELQVSQAKAQGEKDKQIKDLASKADFSTPEGQTKFASDVTKVDPAKGMDFMKQIQEMMKSTGDNEKTQIELIGERADHESNAALPLLNQYQNMISKGVPPQQAAAQMQPAYQQALQSLASVKLKDGSPLLGPEQLKQIIAHPTFDPEFVSGIVQQSKQARESLNAQRETDIKQQVADVDTKKEAETERKDKAQEALKKQEQAGGDLSADAINDLADQYFTSGKMPYMGRGASASTNIIKVQNAYAQKLRAAGMDQMAAQVEQIAFKGAQAAYTQVMKQKEAIGNYEKTALKNMDLVKQASEKLDRGGSPIVNKWILAGRKAIKGDTDVTNLDTTITSFVQEYAKVMSGSTGASGSTDAQTQHAYDLLNKAMNKEQIQTTLDTLTKEMNNRVSSYDDQLGELRQTIQQGAMNAPQAQPATPSQTSSKSVAAPSPEDYYKKYGLTPP